MKNSGIKILLVFLVIFQIGLGVKSILISMPFFYGSAKIDLTSIDKIILTGFFTISLLIGLIALLLAISKKQVPENKKVETIIKSEIKEKSDQKKALEEEKKRIQMLNEKKKSLVTELSKDLNFSEGIQKYSEKVLMNISKHFNIMQGLFYLKDKQDNMYRKAGTYAYFSQEELWEFADDIGLSGQVASNKKLLNISNLPDKYITVHSGLGKSSPAHLVIFPILYNNESVGIVELASFVKFDTFTEEVLMEFSLLVGNQLATLNETSTN